MFHAIARLAELLLTPTNFLVIAILLGGLLTTVGRVAVFGRRLATIAAILLGLLALTPAGDALLWSLESRFGASAPDGGPVAGVIVLGGTLGGPGDAIDPPPVQAADRLFVAARLARRFPLARVVVSGGPIDPATNRSEADAVARYLSDLGVAPARMTLERRSADTFENAAFSAALLHPHRGERWLLVTSASHMPRAVACFRKAGFTVVAAPADWRGGGWPGHWSASGQLEKVDLAWKEYVGLLAYRIRGRTADLFPAP